MRPSRLGTWSFISLLAAASACSTIRPPTAASSTPAADAAVAPAQPKAPRKKVLLANTTGTSPFSRVVQAGDFVFVAGQLGFKEGSRELVPGGVGPETRAALEAITANLGKAGLRLEDVVQCNVFLADIADFQAMNDVYATFFPREPPVRTTVGVSGLWGGARVEIDCTAITR